MINLAISIKTLRDSAATVVLACLATIAFVVLFVWAMVNMGTDLLKFVSQFSFLKNIFELSLGIRVEGDVSINLLLGVTFTHLVVLVLAWGTIIAAVTRTTVGEVEQGTADILFSLPVARWSVLLSTTVVWLLMAVLLACSAWVGICIGGMAFARDEPVAFSKFIPVAVNLLALHWAVGGIGLLVSALSPRRGVAIGTVVGIALASVTLNFVEPFIPVLRPFRVLGLLYYFRPVDIVRTGVWPLTQCAVLATTALVCWAIGTVVFCRKDIPAA